MGKLWGCIWALTFLSVILTSNAAIDLHHQNNIHQQQQQSTLKNACSLPSTPLSHIQGTEETSPLNHQQVTVEATVSAIFNAPRQIKGYFLIEDFADQDNNSQTSEGIFVYDKANNKRLNVLDRVRLTATVKEFKGVTELTRVKNLLICGYAAQLPPVPTLSFPAQSRDLEALESMPIFFPDSGLQVASLYDYGRYGTLLLSSKPLSIPTNIALPGKAAQFISRDNQRQSILLDDASFKQNPPMLPWPAPYFSADNRVRIGDKIIANTSLNRPADAIVFYSHGQYRLLPTGPLELLQKSSEPVLQPRNEPQDIRIAAFNVLNFFNGDGLGGGFPTERGAHNHREFNRQKTKILEALSEIDADIFGLMEIENDGFGLHSAINELTQALSHKTQKPYTFIKPKNLKRLNKDAISVGVIYRKDRLSTLGKATVLTQAPFDRYNRPPIIQTFIDRRTQQLFTLAVNHWKSKGCRQATGHQADQLDGQSCWNPKRLEAAQTLSDYLKEQSNVIIMGDLNAYRYEDPIRHLVERGFTHLTPKAGYTYIYQGQKGHLDYILADHQLSTLAVQSQIWNINASEARILDYNLEHKSPLQQQIYYAPNAIRSSDHNPVISDFRFLQNTASQ